MTKFVPGTFAERKIHLSDVLNVNQTRELSPILILGMHNSGTSILSELLHASGVFMGNNMNHYESHFFSIFINNTLLLGSDTAWATLPLPSKRTVLSNYSKIKDIILTNWKTDYLQWGYDGVSSWGIKDPRLCILLPLYLKIFPKAKVVHIIRNPEDVAASLCNKEKSGVGKKNDFKYWEKLTNAYVSKALEYSKDATHYYELSYEDFCQNPDVEVKALFKNLNLNISDKTRQVISKITPKNIGSYERASAQENIDVVNKFDEKTNETSLLLKANNSYKSEIDILKKTILEHENTIRAADNLLSTEKEAAVFKASISSNKLKTTQELNKVLSDQIGSLNLRLDENEKIIHDTLGKLEKTSSMLTLSESEAGQHQRKIHEHLLESEKDKQIYLAKTKSFNSKVQESKATIKKQVSAIESLTQSLSHNKNSLIESSLLLEKVSGKLELSESTCARYFQALKIERNETINKVSSLSVKLHDSNKTIKLQSNKIELLQEQESFSSENQLELKTRLAHESKSLMKVYSRLEETSSLLLLSEARARKLHAEVKHFRTTLAKEKKSVRLRFSELAILTEMLELSTLNSNIEKKLISDYRNKLAREKLSVRERFNELSLFTNLLESAENINKSLSKENDQLHLVMEQFPIFQNTIIGLRTALSKKNIKLNLFNSYHRPLFNRVNLLTSGIRTTDFILITNSNLFDPDWYLNTYPELSSNKRALQDPLWHYLKIGGLEGRNPCKQFDSNFYLRKNPDVKKIGMNPLIHYLRYGKSEGRTFC